MPFTPFHFGVGAALHAAAPHRVSFLAFCAANVIIDVEPLYYMLTDNPPLHRFFHTYIGATLVAVATIVLFSACKRLASRFRLPDIFGWQSLRLPEVAAGSALGTYTHIVLDSIMHLDIRPLAPFSEANALLQLLSLSALQWVCVAAGILGAVMLAIRRWRPRSKNVH